MLIVKELSKKIDNKLILDNINLNIPKGSIYGIIGENGAGKSTLMKVLTGIYLKELYQGIYPTFNEERYIKLMRLFKHDSLENFNKFSKGMKKQVMFIFALSIMPEYLIMDEPFDGLDPHIRKIIWDILIQDVSERQMTIFISSHHLNELDSMCDHIALISDGEIIFEEALDHLKEGYHKLQIVLESGDDMYALEKELNILAHQMMGRVHTLIVEGNLESIDMIVSKYHPIINETLSLSLEEIFLFTLGGKYDELKDIMG